MRVVERACAQVLSVKMLQDRSSAKFDPFSNRAHNGQMRQVGCSEVLERLSAREALGHHVDSRLIKAVTAPGNLFLFTLEDEESFLSLIWQESDFTRLLTPGLPRTLADVAGRMIANSWTFSSLCHPMGLELKYHDPAAFESFRALDAGFDMSKFDFIAVTPANESEKQQSPSGTHYIYDGVHRALVLAHRVMSGQSKYQSVEALLLTPRCD